MKAVEGSQGYHAASSEGGGRGDGGRKGVAFDEGVVARMTPTMKGFTLGGKVGVVTG